MPARARRRSHAVLGVRVGVGQSSREETAARVATVVEADAAMGIAAARWRAASPPNSRNLSRSAYRESGLVLGRRGDDGHE